jgi:hypothetical protein
MIASDDVGLKRRGIVKVLGGNDKRKILKKFHKFTTGIEILVIV